jgi:hypothetical protein
MFIKILESGTSQSRRSNLKANSKIQKSELGQENFRANSPNMAENLRKMKKKVTDN